MSSHSTTYFLAKNPFRENANIQQINIAHKLVQDQANIADTLFKTICKHSHLVQDKIKLFKKKMETLQNLASQSYELVLQNVTSCQQKSNQKNYVQKGFGDLIPKTINDKAVQIFKQTKNGSITQGKLVDIMYKFYCQEQIFEPLVINKPNHVKAYRQRACPQNFRTSQLFLQSVYRKQLLLTYNDKIKISLDKIIKDENDQKLSKLYKKQIRNDPNTYQAIQNIYKKLFQIFYKKYGHKFYQMRLKKFNRIQFIYGKFVQEFFNQTYFNSVPKNVSYLNEQERQVEFKLKFQDWISKYLTLFSCGFCRQQYINSDYNPTVFNGLFLKFVDYFEHIILQHDQICETNSHSIVGLNEQTLSSYYNNQILYPKCPRLHQYFKSELIKYKEFEQTEEKFTNKLKQTFTN